MSIKDDIRQERENLNAMLEERALHDDPFAGRSIGVNYHWKCVKCGTLREWGPSDPVLAPWCCGEQMRLLSKRMTK